MTIASTLLNGTTALVAALSQTQTNGMFACPLNKFSAWTTALTSPCLGNNELGTLHNPHLGPFLTDSVGLHFQIL